MHCSAASVQREARPAPTSHGHPWLLFLNLHILDQIIIINMNEGEFASASTNNFLRLPPLSPSIIDIIISIPFIHKSISGRCSRGMIITIFSYNYQPFFSLKQMLQNKNFTTVNIYEVLL
jgi:hypothetical protein